MTKPSEFKIKLPSGGRIGWSEGRFLVPNDPIVGCIPGDGTGPDIWNASRAVFDEAVARAYGGKRKIAWAPLPAGLDALKATDHGSVLPEETVSAIRELRVAIKGPLTTPSGRAPHVCLECAFEIFADGKAPASCPKCSSPWVTARFRSINVALRQKLDLYACVRPVRHFEGVPAPVKAPEKLDVVIFRENTEDVYAGIEFEQGTAEQKKVYDFLTREMKKSFRPDSGIGIKPISETGSKRLIRMAIRYAIDHKRPSVTLVHKGNIQKFTEGAFRDWGYELAAAEFGRQTVREDALAGQTPEPGRVVIKDRIADQTFQQLLLRPDEYSVLATPNLNGDYLSDAAAAQVGGLGMAPGANIGDGVALFEATHGTAPKYAGKDMVNPGSLILSGVMMFEAMGWNEAASMVLGGLDAAIRQKTVTYDLERQMPGAKRLKTSEFARAIISNMARPGAAVEKEGAAFAS